LIPLHSCSERNLLTTPSRHSSQHDPHSSLSKSSPASARAGKHNGRRGPSQRPRSAR
jgi:hypothetical protein